jgi:hypothetical protein
MLKRHTGAVPASYGFIPIGRRHWRQGAAPGPLGLQGLVQSEGPDSGADGISLCLPALAPIILLPELLQALRHCICQQGVGSPGTGQVALIQTMRKLGHLRRRPQRGSKVALIQTMRKLGHLRRRPQRGSSCARQQRHAAGSCAVRLSVGLGAHKVPQVCQGALHKLAWRVLRNLVRHASLL